jgi:hypothetical protein
MQIHYSVINEHSYFFSKRKEAEKIRARIHQESPKADPLLGLSQMVY